LLKRRVTSMHGASLKNRGTSIVYNYIKGGAKHRHGVKQGDVTKSMHLSVVTRGRQAFISSTNRFSLGKEPCYSLDKAMGRPCSMDIMTNRRIPSHLLDLRLLRLCLRRTRTSGL
jgi:hypothetical protein